MSTAKVSIIVPIYNTERFLERCISSIKNQTLDGIEIILVDDGSNKECSALCDKIAESSAAVKVIHKENGGAGYARNAGLEAATGEYIGFVDSDDYIEPEMYEKLYSAAEKYSADIVMSGVHFVDGNMFGKDGECISKTYFDSDTVFEKDELKNLMLGIAGALPHEPDDSRYGTGVWKNLFRRKVILDNNMKFLSERKILSEDTLFILDYISCAKKAVGIPGAYYCYCRNGDSISKSYDKERFEKIMIFIKELENRLKAVVPYCEYKIYLDRLTQAYGRILCAQEIIHARENKIAFHDLKKHLKEICTRAEISDVLKSYPWYKLPTKQAIFAFCMKYRLYFIQTLIVILRDR